jgi:predicted alpha/beta-hydrolase family hydrolase
MNAWRDRLSTLGEIFPFDYPYMRAGRKSPDRLPTLIAAHGEALSEVRKKAAGAAVVLAGKSMGSRVGCHLALEEQVDALVCLGYPLKSGASGAMRDEVLMKLRVPILFVQGTRDPLCSLEQLAEVRARMTAPTHLHVVEGGNHSLEVSAKQRKAAGRTQEDADAASLGAIRCFLETVLP